MGKLRNSRSIVVLLRLDDSVGHLVGTNWVEVMELGEEQRIGGKAWEQRRCLEDGVERKKSGGLGGGGRGRGGVVVVLLVSFLAGQAVPEK